MIVILIVLGIISYTMQSGSDGGSGGIKVTVEPLTFLVIMMVTAMVVGSIL